MTRIGRQSGSQFVTTIEDGIPKPTDTEVRAVTAHARRYAHTGAEAALFLTMLDLDRYHAITCVQDCDGTLCDCWCHGGAA